MEGSNRLLQLKEEGMKSLFPATAKIMVGMATCGVAAGAGEVWDALRQEVKKRKLDLAIKKTGCIGICQHEPLVDIIMPGYSRVTYDRVKADKAPELIDGLVRRKFAGGMMARIDQEEFLLDNARKRYGAAKVASALAKVVTL